MNSFSLISALVALFSLNTYADSTTVSNDDWLTSSKSSTCMTCDISPLSAFDNKNTDFTEISTPDKTEPTQWRRTTKTDNLNMAESTLSLSRTPIELEWNSGDFRSRLEKVRTVSIGVSGSSHLKFFDKVTTRSKKEEKTLFEEDKPKNMKAIIKYQFSW